MERLALKVQGAVRLNSTDLPAILFCFVLFLSKNENRGFIIGFSDVGF